MNIPQGYLYLEEDAFTFQFFDEDLYSRKSHDHSEKDKKHFRSSNSKTITHAFKMKFIGANPRSIKGTDKLKHYFNYFKGKDQSKWSSKCLNYKGVYYSELYQGIDLNIYDDSGSLKYDFIIHPGANPNQIKIVFEGIDNNKIIDNELIHQTYFGVIKQHKPYSYQDDNEELVEVNSTYQFNEDTLVFNLGNYNINKRLTIDPRLSFGSFSGSSSDNFGLTASYDINENLFGGGTSFGSGYPTTLGVYDNGYNGGVVDIGLSKFSSIDGSLLFSTFIGGNENEAPHSIVVNSQNQVIIMGTTGSSNFPTLNAYQNSFAGGTSNSIGSVGYGMDFTSGCDLFVVKLSEDGSSLLSSTYIGGPLNEGINNSFDLVYNYGDHFRGEVIVDSQDRIIVATNARSGFPVTTSIQPGFVAGNQEAVVFRLASNLSTLEFSTFLGGNLDDAAYGIQLDASENIFITGGSRSTSTNGTVGSYQFSHAGDVDGFIAKIDPTGSNLLAFTYTGTSSFDQNYFVQIDSDDNVWVVGQTEGNFPISPSVYSNPNSGQYFQKYSNDLSSLLLSTEFGRGMSNMIDISPSAFLVSDCGQIYFSGWGGETNHFFRGINSGTTGLPITPDAFKATTDNNDFYLSVFSEDMGSLIYATFFGGDFSHEHVDGGTSRFDKKGNVYQAACAGCGGFSDFPTTPNAWSQTNNALNCNLGVFKFELSIIEAQLSVPTSLVCLPDPIEFSSNGSSGDNFKWYFGDGDSSSLENPSHLYADSGSYNVTLIVSDSKGCLIPDTSSIVVEALNPKTIQFQSIDTICLGESIQLQSNEWDSYNWTPSATLNNSSIQNPIATPLQNTTYSLVASDRCNIDTATIIVNVFNDSLEVSNDTTLCVGNSIQLNVSGGTSYLWSPSTYLDNNTIPNPIATPLIETTYSVQSTSINNCPIQADVLIRVDLGKPNNIAISPDIVICEGDTGTISLSSNTQKSWVSSPTLLLQNDSIASVFPTINSTYEGVFTNTCGDTSLFVNVDVIPLSGPIVLQSINPICPDSSVQLIATDVWDTYNWTPAFSLNNAITYNPIATPDSTTVYELIASDQCKSDTATIEVIVYDDELNVSNDTAICIGNSVQLFVNGGTSYLWNPSTFLNQNNIFNPVSLPTDSIIYYVNSISTNGCPLIDSVFIEVDKSKPTQVNIWVDEPTICNGSSTSIYVTGERERNWILNNGLIPYNEDSARVSPSQNTVYGATISNACGDTSIYTSVGVISLNPSIIGDSIVCVNDTFYLTAFPSNANSYNWIPSNYLNNSTSQQVFGQIDNSQMFKVIVQDNFGCIDSAFHFVDISSSPDIQVIGNQVKEWYESIELWANSSNGSIFWSPDSTLNCYACNTTISNTENPRKYYVTARSEDGCIVQDSVNILINELLFVPNTFSPDGDGKNDLFFAKGVFLDHFELLIFDRWGQIMFQTFDQYEGWDGTYRGVNCKDGVYVWKVIYGGVSGKKTEAVGHVNLLR